MNRPLISVIVPIYNREDCLRECLNSILKQTYANIEIILVDDGSTDHSAAICDQYADKDARVRVLHKENGGVSSARNLGLDVAKGEYVSFVDSDDLVEPTFIEGLVRHADYDYIVSGFQFTPSKKIFALAEASYHGKDGIIEYLTKTGLYRSSGCSSLYKTKIIQENNIRQRIDLRSGEDQEFNLTYLIYCNHIKVIQNCGYIIREHNTTSEYRYALDTIELVHIIDILLEAVKRLESTYNFTADKNGVTYRLAHYPLSKFVESKTTDEYFRIYRRYFPEASYTDLLNHENYSPVDLLVVGIIRNNYLGNIATRDVLISTMQSIFSKEEIEALHGLPYVKKLLALQIVKGNRLGNIIIMLDMLKCRKTLMDTVLRPLCHELKSLTGGGQEAENQTVSIIIPIYNTDKYIEQCARSLFEQTYDNTEFIFVNDATPDAAITVLERIIISYPNRWSDIKIIHHDTNKGPADARWTGIENATGQYIMFCDSDDTLPPNAVETMYNKICQTKVDVVHGEYIQFTTETGYSLKRSKTRNYTDTLTNREELLAYMVRERAFSLCDKIFRYEVFSKIKRSPIKRHLMNEDMLVMAQCFNTIGSFAYIDEVIYHYSFTPTSTTRTTFTPKKAQDKSYTLFAINEMLAPYGTIQRNFQAIIVHDVFRALRCGVLPNDILKYDNNHVTDNLFHYNALTDYYGYMKALYMSIFYHNSMVRKVVNHILPTP